MKKIYVDETVTTKMNVMYLKYLMEVKIMEETKHEYERLRFYT